MAEVVSALEGTVVPMQCFTEPGEMRVLCNHELDGFDHCATRLLWTRVQGGVTRALEQTTLAELVEFAEHGAAPKRQRSAAEERDRARTQRARRVARPCRLHETHEPERKRMADLEIQNLHVDGRGQGDPQGRRPGRVPRRDPRPDGAERVRQVDARQHDHGPPGLRDHRGQDPLPGRGRDRDGGGRARAPRALHGVPVPVRDPRRLGRQLPAHGDQRPPQGARRGPDQPQGLPQAARGADGAARASTASSRGAT